MNLKKGGSFACKIVVLGDSGVGKTALLERFINNRFISCLKSTVGVDFLSKTVSFNDGISLEYNIWDTAGQERFHSVSSIFYRGTNACIIVFDVTNHDSFTRLDFWKNQMFNNSNIDQKIIPMIVFANKCDLEEERTVSKEEIEKYSKETGIMIIETSAKTDQNVRKAFEYLGNLLLPVLAKIMEELQQTLPANNVEDNVTKRSCC